MITADPFDTFAAADLEERLGVDPDAAAEIVADTYTDPAPTLYVSAAGEISCARHGGVYLAESVAAAPDSPTHVTPLDAWIVVPADLAAGQTCEGCE